MADLANIFTENAKDAFEESHKLTAQYALRGVGIGPAYETTFVYIDSISSTDPEAMQTDGQWWRCDFQEAGQWSTPRARPAQEEEVLQETSDGAKEALLVYAEKSACDPLLPRQNPIQIPNVVPELS